MTKNPKANTPLPKVTGTTEAITYSLEEKARFNRMIFTFIFPKLAASLGSLNEINQMMVMFHDPSKDALTVSNLWNKGVSIFNAVTTVNDVPGKIKLAIEDLESSRVVPNEYNRYYSVPYLLRSQISKGNFKPLKYEGLIK